MKYLPIISLAWPAVLLAACSGQGVLSYKMTNMAADTLMVVNIHAGGDSLVADTFYLGYDQQATIGITYPGEGHISNYKETGPTLRDFRQIWVYDHHHRARVASYLPTALWTYHETGRYQAEYLTIVTEKNF